MRSGLLWRLLSLHYVKPAVKKQLVSPSCLLQPAGRAPSSGCCRPQGWAPPALTLPSPPCLHSSCTPLFLPPLATPALLRVTPQGLPHPREDLFFPPGSSPASLAFGLPKADIKNPLLTTWGFLHARSPTHLQIPV